MVTNIKLSGDNDMKVITLWQPWASFIALGWKTIETRTHDRFKNLVCERIAIHAGLILENIKLIEPIKVKGKQGIWNYDFKEGELIYL
jgi:predicted transcriptional regulator